MTVCPTCQDSLSCTSDDSCWCMTLPRVIPIEKGTACYCSNCLVKKVSEYYLSHPTAVNYTPSDQTDSPLLVEGVDYYIDDKGYWVFTSLYHLKKGYCCQNACLHCPYGFKK